MLTFPDRSDPAPWLTTAALLGIFVALSLVLSWPLSNLTVPRLPSHDDAMFSVWRLAWVAHQLVTDPRHLFDANIFWPERNTLAFSDAMLLLGMAGAPLIHAGVHPVLVHNLLLLAAFVSAAYGAARLVGYFTPQVGAQIIAGTIFAFAPYRFSHFGHLELLWTAFLPLALLALYRALRSPTVGRGAQLGIALGCQGLCSIYYLVFGIIWMIPATLLALWHLRVRVTRQHVLAGSIAVVTAAVLLSPYYGPYSAARGDLPPRSAEEVRRYSAEPADFLRVTDGNLLYPFTPPVAPDERALFVGAVPLVLSAVAVGLLRTRTTLAFLVLGVFAFDLALGSNGFSYDVVRRLVPPLDGLRAPARFGVLVLLAVSVLASLAVAHLLDRLSSRRRLAVTAAMLAGLTLEFWSVPVGTRALPLTPSPMYAWLAKQPPAVVLELPAPTPETLWGYETTHQYASIFHWHKLVNGYSGHAPRSYFRALEALRDLRSHRAIQLLLDRQVRFIVLHEALMEHQQFQSLLAACEDTKWFDEVITFPDDRAAVCRVGRF